MKSWSWLVSEMPSGSGDVAGPISQKPREANLGAWTQDVDESFQDLGVAVLAMKLLIEELELLSLESWEGWWTRLESTGPKVEI